MKVTFIATVYNEEKTILDLLRSIFSQSLLPNEIIIVDGGSSDHTTAKIQDSRFKIHDKTKFKILIKKGNRAVGRNFAIKNSSNEIIVCSDAGCILDKNWIKNIIEPFKNKSVDVVAGYYAGRPSSVFQECIIPYVLVMPDKVNSKNFLPASRSMAFRKSFIQKIGGFKEAYSHNEDYVLARTLKKANAKIVFAKEAVVYWIPRKNLRDCFVMFFRFAYGDMESNIVRPKVLFLLARYIIGCVLLLYSIITNQYTYIYLLIGIFILYIVWSVVKNYRYIKKWQAIFILPVLQLTADVSILVGTTIGFIKR